MNDEPLSLEAQVAELRDELEETRREFDNRLDVLEAVFNETRRKAESLEKRRAWTDDVAWLLNWLERNSTNVLTTLVLCSVIVFIFRLKQEDQGRFIDKVLEPQVIGAVGAILASSGLLLRKATEKEKAFQGEPQGQSGAS